MKTNEIQEFTRIFMHSLNKCQLSESSLPLKETETETWTKWKDEQIKVNAVYRTGVGTVLLAALISWPIVFY